MTRYIEADELVEKAWRVGVRTREDLIDFIETAPTIDAVEIVRCSECKFGSTNKSVMTENPIMRCAIFRTMTEPNGYCYKGERREGETYETKPGVQIKI